MKAALAWGGSSSPQSFERAVEWFTTKVNYTRAEWEELSDAAKRRAFFISGAGQLSVIQTVHASAGIAMKAGTSFAEWRAQVEGMLRSEWAGTVANPGHRMETIYRNALQSSYNAGRYHQQTRPAVRAARPWWMFDAILDNLTTEICTGLHGTIVRAEDAFWDSHYPPMHHRCRSNVRTLSQRDGNRRLREGAKTRPDGPEPEDTWGRAPKSQGDEWRPREGDYDPRLWSAYERSRSGADGVMPGRVQSVLDDVLPSA